LPKLARRISCGQLPTSAGGKPGRPGRPGRCVCAGPGYPTGHDCNGPDCAGAAGEPDTAARPETARRLPPWAPADPDL
jgi:hypothetical protein